MIFRKVAINIFLFNLALWMVSCQSKNPPPPSILHADSYTSLTSSEQRTLPVLDNKLLTLEDAVRIGLANSPTYEKQKLVLKLAYNTFYRELWSYLPNLSVSTGGIGFNHINNYNTGYGPAQTSTFSTGNPGISATTQFVLFDGFSRELDVLATYEKIKSQEAALKYARITLINQIKDTYYGVITSKEDIRIQEENLSFQRKMLEVEQEKFKNNLVTYDSVLNFEYNIKKAEMSIIQSRLACKTQEIVFAALLGLTTADFPEGIKYESLESLVLDMSREFTPLGVEYYLDLAIDQRPDLKQYRYQLTAAKYELYSAWGKFAPTVSVEGNWGLTTTKWKYTGQYINYGISAQWDIFENGFERVFNVREKQINLEQAKIDVLQTWIEAVKDVRTAYISLETSLVAERIAQEGYKIAKRQIEMLQEKFENQLTSISRLNQAQSDLVNIEQERLNALIAVYKAKANLDRSCGIQTY